ncbi:GNAT family N-acetyltransferase [Bacillus tianshenii]|uniref:GNAT family N-acetyltransferase n=1 Tax=Sutcliffiella tianshenii TaxID=1463404 RepID=UPI001CD52BAB|nr:GNAT family protein [Bacillus tianshenii]MCA1320985.1 GNAT family N-acetyltransferase [Bacillus tianshenii]
MTFPILETERLILRQVTQDDAGSLLTYLSDPDVMKHVGLDPFETIEDSLGEISWYDSIYKEKTGIRWGITLKEKGEVIGSCGFLKMASQHFRAEVGTELHRDYWGQGIASESLEAVIQYGFLQLNLQRIEGLIEPANLSSKKLFEKHGFVCEGLLRKYEFTCGKFDDLYMYSLLKEDFSGV